MPMKRFMKTMLLVVLFSFLLSIPNAFAITEESDAEVIAVYGEALSPAQLEETKKLLKVNEEENVLELTVTAEDIVKYINGDPNSNMYSSAKITKLKEGEGIRIIQITPENITQVTNDMYANALLTAGVTDAKVEVASPIPVTGHSALTGIFKAYEATGEELDTARLEVADEELNVATKLAEKAGISEDQVSQLLAEIKQAIGEQNPVTREEVEQIVQEKLDEFGIQISEEYKQLLYELFDKIRALDIDFEQLQGQLEELAGSIKDKLQEAGVDEGVLQQIGNFFKDLWNAIVDFFKSLFGN